MKRFLFVFSFFSFVSAVFAQPADTSGVELSPAGCSANEEAVLALVEQEELRLQIQPLGQLWFDMGVSCYEVLPGAEGEPARIAWIDRVGTLRALAFGTSLQTRQLIPAKITSTKCVLKTADLNRDGRTDIIIQENPAGRILLVSQLSADSWQISDWGPHPGQLTGVFGKPDSPIYFAFNEQGTIRVYSRGDGRWEFYAEMPLGDIPLDSEIVPLTTRQDYFLSTKPAYVNRWTRFGPIETEGGRGTEYVVDLYPQWFDWYGHRAWSDLNGDGLLDALSSPPGTRQPWAGMNVPDPYAPLFIETPVELSGLLEFSAHPLAGGDFTGDGVGDVLFTLPQGELALGVSLLAVPASGIKFRSAGTQFVADTRGRFCLPAASAKARTDLTVVSSQFAVASDISLPSGRRVLLKKKTTRVGARFSLGRIVEGPFVCNGYNPQLLARFNRFEQGKWGWLHFGQCASLYGISVVADNYPASFENPLLSGVCCPLPNEDFLLHRGQTRAERICPENQFASGFLPFPGTAEPGQLTCRSLNTERYQFGPVQPGVYVGYGYSSPGGIEKLRWDQIPASLRYFSARLFSNLALTDACISNPPGGLLVGFQDKNDCSAYLFRQVQYKGKPGDPPAGTPVQMFADCRDVSDIYTPYAVCSEDDR